MNRLSPTAFEQFTTALTAFAAGDLSSAVQAARSAQIAAPQSRLAREATRYLEHIAAAGSESVYRSGEAFGAFIRGGGNLALYAALSATLRSIYRSMGALTLLDIGVGDGMALLPALVPSVQHVDLVEPSLPMLERTSSALAAQGVAFHTFAMTLQSFAEHADHKQWDLVQASFSLQSLPPTDRQVALHWLRERTGRLLIAEFDLPHLGTGLDPARIAHMTARYEFGLEEYVGDDGLVAQGFLMPIFFSAFDPGIARTNYEQPMDAWVADLNTAGFTQVTRHHLYDYWWAPAYLLDAA